MKNTKDIKYRLIFVKSTRGKLGVRIAEVSLAEFKKFRRHQVDLVNGMADSELFGEVFGKNSPYSRSKTIANALIIHDAVDLEQ